VTPEDAIETGLLTRLTHGTNGITVAAGKYCADTGGVQVWQGDISLDPESLIKWAHSGIAEGPVCLIVVGNNVTYEHDKARHVVGEYSVDLYLATANYRSEHDAVDGDAGGDARKPGIRQMKSDILDRVLAFGFATDADGAYQPNLVLNRGTLMAVQEGMALYRLEFTARMGTRHDLTTWASIHDLNGVDVTLQKEPDAGVGEEFQVVIKTD